MSRADHSGGVAYQRILSALQTMNRRVVDRGDRAMAQCPAHDDGNPSLALNAIEGQVLIHCHAGCDVKSVVGALGMTLADLFDHPRGATYLYPDRRKVHRGPDKSFRQSGNTHGRSLFRADRINETSLVYVVEGEKDVLAVEAAGGTAVCSAMGAGNSDKFDWSPLADKDVIIVADKDDPGRRHASSIALRLYGLAASVTITEPASGKDFSDHFAAGKNLAELVTLVQSEAPSGVARSSLTPQQKKSAAARLVEMTQERYELGCTDDDEPFGANKAQPHIAMLLRGGRAGLRADVAARYFSETGNVASGQALADAVCILEGLAARQQPERLYLRVASTQDSVYIDTGRLDGQVIRIADGGWSLIPSAPVRFLRTKLTGQMDIPAGDPNLDLLWNFVNVAEEDRPVLLAVLVAALLQSDCPHPILALFAEQGSAKSTTTRMLVELIDPSPVPLRQAPRDAESWVTAAAGSWVVALDNLSGISGWLSDSLCRAVTGDGNVKRALYTDAGLSIVSFRRCIILNGIDVGAVRPDLGERLAVVDLKRIDLRSRRTEAQIFQEWSTARPQILGGLLNLAAAVHNQRTDGPLSFTPRMADFARLLAAVDLQRGTNGLARYMARANQLSEDSLQADPFIESLRDICTEPLLGKTGAELLSIVTAAVELGRRPIGWPKNGRDVTTALKRNATALRNLGWVIEDDGAHNHRNVLRWTIGPPEREDDSGKHSSRSSHPRQKTDLSEPRSSIMAC
jgi:Toprim domain